MNMHTGATLPRIKNSGSLFLYNITEFGLTFDLLLKNHKQTKYSNIHKSTVVHQTKLCLRKGSLMFLFVTSWPVD